MAQSLQIDAVTRALGDTVVIKAKERGGDERTLYGARLKNGQIVASCEALGGTTSISLASAMDPLKQIGAVPIGTDWVRDVCRYNPARSESNRLATPTLGAEVFPYPDIGKRLIAMKLQDGETSLTFVSLQAISHAFGRMHWLLLGVGDFSPTSPLFDLDGNLLGFVSRYRTDDGLIVAYPLMDQVWYKTPATKPNGVERVARDFWLTGLSMHDDPGRLVRHCESWATVAAAMDMSAVADMTVEALICHAIAQAEDDPQTAAASATALLEVFSMGGRTVVREYLLAQLYTTAGLFEEARATWQAILRHEPRHVPTLLAYGTNLVAEARGQSFARAIDVLHRAAILTGFGDQVIVVNYGWSLVFGGDVEKAKAVFSNGLEKFGPIPRLVLGLGRVACTLGDQQLALEQYETLKRQRSAYADRLYTQCIAKLSSHG